MKIINDESSNKPRDINLKKFDGDVLSYIEKTGVAVSKFLLIAAKEKIERDKAK